MQKLNTTQCSSHFVDMNLQFIFSLFVEFTLFVTQYRRITFVNSGESESSNDKREMYEFVRINVANTCVT